MVSTKIEPTLSNVRQALALPDFDARSAWLKMAPMPRPLERPADMTGTVKLAGVLLLLYPLDNHLTFSLTRRTDTLAHHKGQVSLPGGGREGGETLAQTALRETCEEVHVCLDESCLIGELTSLYLIVSDFEIAPHVGFTPTRPIFEPDPIEVAEMVEMPLVLLLDDTVKTTERWTLRGTEMDVPFYHVKGHKIWGATAAILSEFEWRLRSILKVT
jgi:8-oxo-dGTP pyrophosphatase MutT (NUDIX family)